MTAKHPAAFINAIKESRDFDLAIAQLQETWDEYCTLKAASVKAGEVAVRPLEWLPVHDGAWLRAESLGCVYELLVSAGDVSERQAAAQADYEARIRSALVVEPAPTASVGAMREACRQVAIVRATRCANDLATPPNIRGLGPDTHALEYGKRVALEIAHDIAALAAANQSDGGVEGHARTCDGPAVPPPGGVTQAGHSPSIASGGERNRVRKEAGIKPGPSDTRIIGTAGEYVIDNRSSFIPKTYLTEDECKSLDEFESLNIVPGPSDTPSAPQAVEAVSVDEMALREKLRAILVDKVDIAAVDLQDFDGALDVLLSEFKMEGRNVEIERFRTELADAKCAIATFASDAQEEKSRADQAQRALACFESADDNDWDRLIDFLDQSAHGQFWRDALTRFRSLISK